MLDKLIKSFVFLKADVTRLRESVAKLEKAYSVVKEGEPGGYSGENPSVKDIVVAVLAELPALKGGASSDVKAIVEDILATMPKPRDGRDVPVVSVSDVAAIVLAKIPKPKDGRDGPDLETVVRRVKAQVQDGERGPPGPQGRPGKNGVSVTDVQLNNNDLFVFLDGKKRKAGTVKVPVATAPFNPGNGGGGSTSRAATPTDTSRVGSFEYNDLATQTTPVTVPPGFVNVDITNDAEGPFTNRAFKPEGVADVWDAGVNEFIWSYLKLGDMVDIRLDLEVTTSRPNQELIVELLVAVGANEYVIPFVGIFVRQVGLVKLNTYSGIYMRDLNTLNNNAKFRIRSDRAATLVVNGWYTRVTLF